MGRHKEKWVQLTVLALLTSQWVGSEFCKHKKQTFYQEHDAILFC